jgi:hypothetical protein
MEAKSYSDILKGPLPDTMTQVTRPAALAPRVATGGVSSVFDQGKPAAPPPTKPRQHRRLEEIETVKMLPPTESIAPPSHYEEMYYALVELAKADSGMKLTKKEKESLTRWASKNKQPLIARKVNNGPTPYVAWAISKKGPKP